MIEEEVKVTQKQLTCAEDKYKVRRGYHLDQTLLCVLFWHLLQTKVGRRKDKIAEDQKRQIGKHSEFLLPSGSLTL